LPGSVALGPRLGWCADAVNVAADVIVVATLSEVAAKYFFLLFGWQRPADSTLALILAAGAFIVV
jgi:hypothetical protein